MYKKLLIGAAVLMGIIFSFTFCFATDGAQNVANDIRNVVGGAENVVENGARDISNGVKDITGDVENGANQVTNNVKSGLTDGQDGMNHDYTATRTATDNTLMGMNATAWTWLIIGVVAIAIVALVWYYSLQFNHHRKD